MKDLNGKTMEAERKTYKMELVLRDGTREVVYDVTISYDVREKDRKMKSIKKNR